MAICVDIVPTPCGGTNKLTMKDACNDVHFTGIEDTTINQGVGIDLTEGIHAYDGSGNEIEYTVTPDSIDKCDVGEHTVVYRTIGEGDKFLPSFCMDNVDVTLGDTFCNEILLEEDRIVTITQADPPTIEGIETIPTIYPNEEFDPTEGITATDDNGKTIDFTYSGRVEDSSEGTIASFETEFEQDALSVVADIEPIQDLHGYDKPWAGGAGRNLLNIGGRVDQTNAGVRYTSDDNYIIGNGTKDGGGYAPFPTLGMTLDAGTYYARGFVVSGTASNEVSAYITDGSNNLTTGGILTAEKPFTLESQTTVYPRFAVWNDGTVLTNYTVGIVVSKTSGIDKFYPYSNICPISGHDEVNVSVCGKNFFDASKYQNLVTDYEYSYQSYHCKAIQLKPNTTYTVSQRAGVADSSVILLLNNKSNINDAGYFDCRTTGSSKTFTTDESGCLYIGVLYSNDTAYNARLALCKIQIELNTPYTDYEPYNGTTYEVSFGTAGTVYGGTVDVVSGVLTVTDGNIASYNGETLPSTWISDRDVYASGTTPTTGAQVVYKLATPTTVQLTATEVQTLLGQNNVWADTGDVKVIYEKEMPASGNIEYLTAGFKIITYMATDECGNQTVEQRIIYVLGDTSQVCMAEVCTAHTACVVSKICSSEICTAQCS